MKVNYFEEQGLQENYIDLHYAVENEETLTVKKFLHSLETPILGKNPDEEKERLISPGEILYMEIVERKSFLYLFDSVWRTDTTLLGFLERYKEQGFIRVSKSMVLNIHYVKELKAELNMRIHIVLDNGETIILSRNYRKDFLKYIDRLRKAKVTT